MRATKVLPDSYVRYEAFRREALKKVALWLNVPAVLLFLITYPLFNGLARMLRPDFAGRLTFSKPRFDLALLVVALAGYLAFSAVHELIHAAILWLFTRERPALHVSLRGACVEVPLSYLPRNALLLTSLAPVCLLSLAAPALLLLVPQKLVGLMVLLLAANVAGSAWDLAGSTFVSLLPASCYLSTRSDIYLPRSLLAQQKPESAPRWRVRFRLFLERAVSRLGSRSAA